MVKKSLTDTDYKNILRFYKTTIPTTTSAFRQKARRMISSKLCRCIKSRKFNNEQIAIGACTRTIVNAKGFHRGKFNCKKTQKIKLYK